MTEDYMVGWRDQLSGHEFGWTPGVCDGHGAGESPLLSRSGGEKGLRGSGAGTLGVPLGGTRRVGGKSRDLTLSTKVHLVKAMVFPVVMYGCEIWTIKLSAKELMLLNCGAGEDS